MKKKNTAAVIATARLLASPDNVNPEYDRALVELVCIATGNDELLDERAEAEKFVLGRTNLEQV